MLLMNATIPAFVTKCCYCEFEGMMPLSCTSSATSSYVEVAPEMECHFIHSTHDDVAEDVHDMGIIPSNSQ